MLKLLAPLGLLALFGSVACTTDRPAEEARPVEGEEPWDWTPWELREEKAADYQAHVTRMAAEEFPLPIGDLECGDDADCWDGLVVADVFYGRWSLPIAAELVPSLAIATDGERELRAIDGLDPVHYLAEMTPTGPTLLVLSEYPWEPTSKQLAIEVRDRRCAVREVLVDAEVTTPEECDRLFHSWFTTDWSPPWLDDPTLRLVDPTERHTEPTVAHLAQVEAEVQAGADTDDLAVVDQWGNDIGRPYLDPLDALAARLERNCHAEVGFPCRSGFTIERESDTELSAILTYQARRVDNEPAHRVSVSLGRVTLRKLGSTTWWLTTVGPTGAYDTYETTTSAEEADRLFANCCPITIESGW